MQRPILNKYVDVLGQAEVLHSLRESPGRYVPFLGAGVSKEAQVPLANEICEDIKTRLLTGRTDIADIDAWVQETLAWKDASRRYMRCLDAYGSADERLTYFRELLKDSRPAFAHHALALLMTRGRFFETALTTNFDKLLERAFVEQGVRECQAIRTEEEVEYWVAESGKCYLFKLHGDYDTHNILNTQPETRSVPEFFLSHAMNSLRGRGLLVLGSAANEESIVEFIKQLSASDERPVLSRGIRWGVFVGSRRPENLSAADELTYLEKAIERGAVSRQVVELLADMHTKFGDRRPCSLFPVWGSGNFLLSLINTSSDSDLVQKAQLFLDHNMRLHATFRKQGMEPNVIETHIEKLENALRKIGLDLPAPDRSARNAFYASSKDSPTQVRIAYGDVTTAATMNNGDFSECRRAIVSPEDTTISAGGGVALRLLTRAGPRQLLNELAKLSPITQGSCAATSAGNLPVHYILHAAALRILPDGSYDISSEQIEKTIRDVFNVGEALQIGATWIPLLGAGVADIPPAESLAAIVKAIFRAETRLPKRIVTIVVFQESILGRDAVRAVLRSTLPTDYTVTED